MRRLLASLYATHFKRGEMKKRQEKAPQWAALFSVFFSLMLLKRSKPIS